MKPFPNTLTTLLAMAAGAGFTLAAQAQSLTQAEYKADKDQISATYKTDRAACNALQGQSRNICIAQAKGKEKVDMTHLEERYKPSEKTRYKARMAKADADYSVAKVRCDDRSGEARQTCRKEAKAAHATATAEAKAQKK